MEKYLTPENDEILFWMNVFLNLGNVAYDKEVPLIDRLFFGYWIMIEISNHLIENF